MGRKNIFFALKVPVIIGTLLLFMAITVGACDEEPEYTGASLIPEVIGGDIFEFTDSALVSKTVKADTISANANFAILGNIENNTFGYSAASFAVRLHPATNLKIDLGDNYHFDSIKLEFQITEFIGNSSATHKIGIHRVKKELFEQYKELNSYDNVSKYIESPINESIDFVPWDYHHNDSIQVSINSKEKKAINKANILLDKDFGKEIFDLINTDATKSDTNFIKKLGGLYIKSEGATVNSFVKVDLSTTVLKLYYGNSATDDKSSKIKYKTISLLNKTNLTTLHKGYALFKDDQKNSEITKVPLGKEDTVAYIKTNGTYWVEINIPKTEKFLRSNNKPAIMKAELIVNAQGLSDMPVKQIVLRHKIDNKTYSVESLIPTNYKINSTPSVGNYYKGKREYKFDITNHALQYSKGNIKKLNIYLAPISNSYQWGIIKNTKETPIKVRILYSKP